MSKEIKYFGYYDSLSNAEEERTYSPAAKTKMDYVCQVLNRCGFDVCLVSPCKTRTSKVLPGKTLKLDERNTLKLFMTLGSGSKLRHALDYLLGNLLLFIYLLRHVRKDEQILVYHSLGYGNVINLARRIRRFKVILEVEEIYQDAVDCSPRRQRIEYQSFDQADSFIFPSAHLGDRINRNHRPSLLIHGTYSISASPLQRSLDHRIHVVYAGTFERRKGGALAAIDAAVFLPDSYHVHILGFGSEQEVEDILSAIADVNAQSSAQVTYDGMLTGQTYENFLHTCHIGLSTQNPDLAFNDTSFPSKILSYMAHGLQVVSARIKVVETSAVGEYVECYDGSSPRDIAEAIIRVDVNHHVDGRSILKRLDQELVRQIPSFMQSCR